MMYKTIEEKIADIKAGDHYALEEMMESYKPVILGLKKRYFIKELDFDDWLQEGWIVLYQSIKNFDAQKGVSLGLYFKQNLERRLCSLLRKQHTAKREGELAVQSLEEKMENQGDSFYFQETLVTSNVLEAICLRQQINSFHYELSELEWQVFSCFLNGQTIADIALELTFSEEQIKNALDRSKRKLKKYLAS